MTALGLGLAAALVAIAIGRVPLLVTLDWKLYDQHVRWAADPSQARRDIVTVAIDESSIRQLEPVVGRWPWPRVVHGALIDFLARAPARVVAYDVLFTEQDRRGAFDVGGTSWTGAESDQALADAVARARNVVLLADVTFEGLEPEGGTEADPTAAVETSVPPGAATGPILDASFEERPAPLWPYPALARAARAFGHNYQVLDPDGPLRRVVPFVRHPGGTLAALPVVAWAVAEGIPLERATVEGAALAVAGRRMPLLLEQLPRFDRTPDAVPSLGRRVLVDFRGPAVLADGRTTTYREYSFYDLFYAEQQLLSGETPHVDPAIFRGATVIVGVTAAGLHDVFAVPFGTGGKMSGAQLHANVVDQLATGRFRQPVRASTVAALTTTVSVIVGAAFVLGGVRWGSVTLVVLLAALAGVARERFGAGLWLPLVTPLLGLVATGVSGLAYQYFVEGREKRAVKRLFSRYVSKDIFEQVLANPTLAELGGSRREMSVLFSDIRGFTSMTERGAPEALVAQLNEYFSAMVEIVFAHRGTLDKFVGDMVMALFGAPVEDPDHADHAVETALAMVSQLDALNARWEAEGRPTLGIGIGINSGEMIAGNIGAEKIRSYTVIGDHVNLGARLESLNKDHGTSIIISEYTKQRLRGAYDARPLGDVVVKGKSVPVGIWEIRPRGQGDTT